MSMSMSQCWPRPMSLHGITKPLREPMLTKIYVAIWHITWPDIIKPLPEPMLTRDYWHPSLAVQFWQKMCKIWWQKLLFKIKLSNTSYTSPRVQWINLKKIKYSDTFLTHSIFSRNPHNRHPITGPWYGVSFVNSKPNLYAASAIAMYIISNIIYWTQIQQH